MAELDERAFKRDNRFLLRLVLLLVIAIAGGVWLFSYLTGEGTRGCAARAIGGVAEEPPSE